MDRALDLRSGRSVWGAYRAPAVPTSKLSRDIKTDVLVVGMGISGAMLAEALSADGHSVTVIDRRGAVRGSTMATTALVLFEIDQPVSLLARRLGKERAARAWQRSLLSVVSLRARISDLAIKCRIEPRPSLYLAGDLLTASQLRAEASVRQSIGLFSKYLPSKDLADQFGIDRDGAILGDGSLVLDPVKLSRGLLLRAVERGVRLYAPVEAVAIEDDRDEVVVVTREGQTISARHIVSATGYELVDLVPSTGHKIISTWAIATRPQRRNLWPTEAMIWEAADPYLYIRATSDGRVICGGEDEDFVDEQKRDALIEEKSKRLSRKLATPLPRIDTAPAYAWTGSFGTTPTGLPLIGRLPRHPRVLAVQGYGGNAIAYSQIGSQLIAALLRGEQDPDADLFAFRQ